MGTKQCLKCVNSTIDYFIDVHKFRQIRDQNLLPVNCTFFIKMRA